MALRLRSFLIGALAGLGADAVAQTRMTLKPGGAAKGDPSAAAQGQAMAILPLISILYGGILPAGLFIYWIASTLFSLVQQYLILGLIIIYINIMANDLIETVKIDLFADEVYVFTPKGDVTVPDYVFYVWRNGTYAEMA